MKPYYQDALVTLYHGDCLKIMPYLQEQSFHAVITDEPYGTTACSWDSPIPFDAMWANLKRLVKPRGAIVLFGSQPFTSALVMSNIEWFKYAWVWRKNRGSNFANANQMPIKEHEDICVFGQQPSYNPQRHERRGGGAARAAYGYKDRKANSPHISIVKDKGFRTEDRLPGSVIDCNTQVGLHPTQKPLLLMEYLVKTYTNEGDLVLDFTTGSGTTLRAAKNLKRRSVGIELLEEYCQVAVKRLAPTFEEAIVDNSTIDDLPLFAQEQPL